MSEVVGFILLRYAVIGGGIILVLLLLGVFVLLFRKKS
jgi:hypothetical protein